MFRLRDALFTDGDSVLVKLLGMLLWLTWTWALWWARSGFAPAPAGSPRARRSCPWSPPWCTAAWSTAAGTQTVSGREERSLSVRGICWQTGLQIAAAWLPLATALGALACVELASQWEHAIPWSPTPRLGSFLYFSHYVQFNFTTRLKINLSKFLVFNLI